MLLQRERKRKNKREILASWSACCVIWLVSLEGFCELSATRIPKTTITIALVGCVSSSDRCLPWVSVSGNATPPLPIVVHDVAGSRSTTDWLPLTAFSAWLADDRTGPVLCRVPLLLVCFSEICSSLYMNIYIWCGVCKCLWCHEDWVWFFWKKGSLIYSFLMVFM